jgi:leucyl-tRNA---protein transferase
VDTESPDRALVEHLRSVIDGSGLVPTSHEPCPYLPDRAARLLVLAPPSFEPGLYTALLQLNFRRSSHVVYRPQCLSCTLCRSVRVPVAEFRPDRSQRRCLARNRDVLATLTTAEPSTEKHELYARYLEARHDRHMSGSWREFQALFYDAPALTLEVTYRIGDRLLGAGVVDVEPAALSAVYFYFDPDEEARSPGVLNVLWMLEECRRRGIPHLYLGYHVEGCRKMEYKSRYRPCEILQPDGHWARLG